MMELRFATSSNAARLGIFSFLLFAALLIGYLYETYEEGRDDAALQSRNYAWTLSEQARSVFEAADDELLSLEEFLKQSDFTQRAQDPSRPARIHEVFMRYTSNRKLLDALNAFDAYGNLLYSSVDPLPKVHISDRQYFQQIKAHPELGRVFSDPLISRTTGKPTIIMARRFLSADGKFIGTIQAYVGLDQFVKVYRSLDIGKHGVVAMRTAHGFMRMAEYPVVSEQMEPIAAPRSHPLTAVFDQKQMQGTLDIVSPMDQLQRTVSFHRIDDYPFYIYVGSAVDDYEARWKIRAVILGLALAVYGAIVFLFVHDVTESRLIEQQSRHKAHHDHLTGLPNRVLFMDQIEHSLLLAKRNQQKMAMLFLDLDGFKQVNDTLGHDVGDLLLTEVAKRLRLIIRSSDTVARMGGDEFTFVLNDIGDDESASSVAQKIIAALSIPFDLKGKQCHIGCSIGIAVYPIDADECETLLRQSDEAMYLAKQSGKNTYRFHRDVTHTA
jgi:diguanylate cyclase (GGDEF)-like protein